MGNIDYGMFLYVHVHVYNIICTCIMTTPVQTNHSFIIKKNGINIMYETDEKFPLTSRFLLLFLAKYFKIKCVIVQKLEFEGIWTLNCWCPVFFISGHLNLKHTKYLKICQKQENNSWGVINMSKLRLMLYLE